MKELNVPKCTLIIMRYIKCVNDKYGERDNILKSNKK